MFTGAHTSWGSLWAIAMLQGRVVKWGRIASQSKQDPGGSWCSDSS